MAAFICILEFVMSEKSRTFAAELENYKLSCASSLAISIMLVSLSCESSARLFVYYSSVQKKIP